MHHGSTVFAQIMAGLDSKEFARCAEDFPTTRKTSALSAYDHFAAMVFAQLTFREGLRDIEACLGARRHLLYHSGIRGRVTRSNLSYANEHRSWEIFAQITLVLMRKAERLYRGTPMPIDLDGDLFAIDATLIDLSLKLFPWAQRQKTEAAIKLNVMLSLAGDIPVFCSLKDGKYADVHALDDIPPIRGAYYVMDRGYTDLARLHRFNAAGAWFVIRGRRNLRWYVSASRKVDRCTGLRCDQTIRFNSADGRRHYPGKVRRVRFKDPQTGMSLVFFTNNFEIDALTVAEIYRNRWRIETFFKWLKQNLRLKAFFSRSPNGVRAQVMSALSAYLLVAIAKKQSLLTGTMHQLLQIASICILEKIPLPELLMKFDTRTEQDDKQMLLAINET